MSASSDIIVPEMEIEEIQLGSPRMKLFVEFPWRLYRGDPHWTPALRGELLGNRLLGLVGLLTPTHPYHQHSEVSHFLAWRDGRPVGRIAAAINRRFNEYHSARIGFFGFFEVIQDYQVASALLNEARRWVKARGMDIMRGPGEYSNATHERQGILIDGFQYPPTVELTHNPPYYAEFMDRYGLVRAKDYHAYTFAIRPVSDRVNKLAEWARSRRAIETRPLNKKELAAEVRLIINIYNQAWSRNWGFLPICDSEADSMAESLRMIVDPGLVRFAMVKGEPVAVLGLFPDPNYALRPRWRWYGDPDVLRVARLLLMRRHIPRTRLMFFGVRPGFRNLGMDAILFQEVHEYAITRGYVQSEASMLLEDNDLILRVSKTMGGTRYKTWRIYEMPLGGA